MVTLPSKVAQSRTQRATDLSHLPLPVRHVQGATTDVNDLLPRWKHHLARFLLLLLLL